MTTCAWGNAYLKCQIYKQDCCHTFENSYVKPEICFCKHLDHVHVLVIPLQDIQLHLTEQCWPVQHGGKSVLLRMWILMIMLDKCLLMDVLNLLECFPTFSCFKALQICMNFGNSCFILNFWYYWVVPMVLDAEVDSRVTEMVEGMKEHCSIEDFFFDCISLPARFLDAWLMKPLGLMATAAVATPDMHIMDPLITNSAASRVCNGGWTCCLFRSGDGSALK